MDPCILFALLFWTLFVLFAGFTIGYIAAIPTGKKESSMTPTPDQIAELKSKIGALALHIVVGKYANANGKLGRPELVNLLSDAGVGNFITRGVWAEGIIKELDRNADGAISVDEFMEVLKGGKP